MITRRVIFYTYCYNCKKRTKIEMNNDIPEGFCTECDKSDYKGIELVHDSKESEEQYHERRRDQIMNMPTHDYRE